MFRIAVTNTLNHPEELSLVMNFTLLIGCTKLHEGIAENLPGTYMPFGTAKADLRNS